MNRSELARVIAEKTGLSITDAEEVVNAFSDTITEVLARGEKVIYSNFGTFYTVHYPSKIIIHPKLGPLKKMVMMPTNVAKWMPAENIKEMVKKSIVQESVTMHGSKKVSTAPLNPTSSRGVASAQSQKSIFDDEEVEIPIKRKSTKIVEEPVSSSVGNTPGVSGHANPGGVGIDEKKTKPVNIYEELMKDGSKEESTFGDAIRIKKDKPFWKRMFENDGDAAASESEDQSTKSATKVSLLDSGIFDKSNLSGNLPKTPPKEQTETQPKLEEKNVPEANQPITPAPSPEMPIKPFENTFSTVPANIAYIDLSKTVVPREVLQQVPEKVARHYKVVPVEEKDNELIVAMTDPEDVEAKEIIKKLTQKKISIRLATESDLSHVLDQYQGFESEVQEAVNTANESTGGQISEEEKKNLIDAAAEDAPAARIVSSLLRRAIRDKASDIHIEPLEDEVQVRFRLDGILRKKITFPKDVHAAVVSRIKILCSLKIDEQRLPQDGRFSIDMDNRRVDFRVSTMPTAYGEKIVMRILDKMTGILSVEELGLSGSGLASLNEYLTKTHGMILVTGPTGSGKTTTLYALISKLFEEGVNICTLEDPIEYQIPGINQSQVNANINYTFASGLRSLVRQDPDIIMIGEIRDGETAEMAVQSALTGHVVLSTLHTNDAAGAAPRLIDMGVEPFLLTSSVNIVIGQRLSRKICEDCKEEAQIPEAELETVKSIIDSMPPAEKAEMKKKELKFYHGKGCKTCSDTGYKGRLGIYEVLPFTEDVKDLILQRSSSFKLQEKAVANGMVTMIQDGVIKALNGQTTLEEVWRVTKD